MPCGCKIRGAVRLLFESQLERPFQNVSLHASSLLSGNVEACAVEPRKRTVLMLQGLMGPLFRRLGQGLTDAGHKVLKINFNGGDRLFWRLPNGID